MVIRFLVLKLTFIRVYIFYHSTCNPRDILKIIRYKSVCKFRYRRVLKLHKYNQIGKTSHSSSRDLISVDFACKEPLTVKSERKNNFRCIFYP